MNTLVGMISALVGYVLFFWCCFGVSVTLAALKLDGQLDWIWLTVALPITIPAWIMVISVTVKLVTGGKK